MLDEKLKSYNICEQCCNNKDCKYYAETCEVIEYFKDTPLNIHFPMCSEYKSWLIKITEDIEPLTVIEYADIKNKDLSYFENMIYKNCNAFNLNDDEIKDIKEI